MEELGFNLPGFDFRVRGVTSISADVHKYGYGAKGASIILHKTAELRKKHFFAHTDWPGGLFGSATFSGSKSGGPVIAAWSVLKLLGKEGYLNLVKRTMEATRIIKDGINSIDGLNVISDPEMSVFSFSSENNDIHIIGDHMGTKGWTFDRIMQPDGIHLLVTYDNIPYAEQFIDDLRNSVVEVRKSTLKKVTSRITSGFIGAMDRFFPDKTKDLIVSKSAESMKGDGNSKSKSSAAFYGIIADPDKKDDLPQLVLDILDEMYRIK
jgi:glutamate/tyrosine decarboxylase-like PLP-dependent enzyme